MRLALWQGEGVAGDLGATLAELSRVARSAADRSADLLVFPEGYLSGYYLPALRPDDLRGVPEALAEVGRIAARTGLGIVVGSHIAEEDTIHNTAVVFDSAGRETGRYRKRALFGPWEKGSFTPGGGMMSFDCADLRVGIAICYDVEFPELIRPYAQMGVDLVVVPTALMAPHHRIAQMVVPVRAMENQIFVAYCNRVGHESGLDYVGWSCICGPRGNIICRASDQPELLVGEVLRSELENERQENNYLEDLAAMDPPQP